MSDPPRSYGDGVVPPRGTGTVPRPFERSPAARSSAEQELRQGLGRAHARFEGLLAVLAHEGVRVLAVGQEQEADRLVVGRERQADLERAPRGLAAGRVAVEAEHHRRRSSAAASARAPAWSRCRAWPPRSRRRAGRAPPRPCSPRPPARSRRRGSRRAPRTGRRARGPSRTAASPASSGTSARPRRARGRRSRSPRRAR